MTIRTEDELPVIPDFYQHSPMCYCGSLIWTVQVSWEDDEIATYSKEMFCSECGNEMVTPPYHGDKPKPVRK